MGNNAWPGFKWQLYDYYLKPTAGYFGFRKATQPWAIMLNLHTNDVIVVNSTLTARNGLKATARLYSIAADGTIAQSGQAVSAVNLSIAENAWTKAMNLTSAMSGLSLTYLVRLNLSDADNPPVCDNLYWYSTQKDVLGSTDGGVRAWTQVADCTLLGKLRTTDSVSIIADGRSNGGRDSVDITILNADKTDLAFFMRAEITRGNDGNEVLPAFYSDNYFSLWPGESKTITVAYAGRDLNGQAAWIRLKGANVGRKTVAVRPLTSVNDVSKFNRSGGNTLKLMPFLDGLPQTKRSTPAVSVFYHLDGRRIRNLHVNSHYRTKAPAGIYFVQTPASGEKISSSPVKQSNNRD